MKPAAIQKKNHFYFFGVNLSDVLGFGLADFEIVLPRTSHVSAELQGLTDSERKVESQESPPSARNAVYCRYRHRPTRQHTYPMKTKEQRMVIPRQSQY